jgi:hypothetical protein
VTDSGVTGSGVTGSGVTGSGVTDSEVTLSGAAVPGAADPGAAVPGAATSGAAASGALPGAVGSASAAAPGVGAAGVPASGVTAWGPAVSGGGTCCDPSPGFSVLDTHRSVPRRIGDTAAVSSPPAGPVPVAFCPCPPVLLPEVAGGAAADTAALLAACAEAVAALAAGRPDAVVVVGPGAEGRYGSGDSGDLRGFGVDLEVPLDGAVRPGGRRLPLSLTVGAWLLDRAGYAGVRVGAGPEDLAAAVAELPGRAGLLVMGDGSARRGEKAPGFLDPAAAPFDAAVAAALAQGDAGALAALDPAEGERLLAAGVPAWRAVGALLAGRDVAGGLLLDDAPFGVGYLVASWTAR